MIPGNLVGIVQYIEGLNSILRMRPASRTMKGMRGPDYSPGPVRQEGGSGGGDADKAVVAALKASKSSGQLGSQITNGFYDPSDVWGSNMYDYEALMNQGHCCNPFHTSGYGGGSPIQTSIGLATDGAFRQLRHVRLRRSVPRSRQPLVHSLGGWHAVMLRRRDHS